MRAIVILTFLVSSSLLYAQGDIKATASEQQNYTQIISQHLQSLSEGKHSTELYMNLGYAYYQKGDLANAILYYEKALKLEPRDKDVLNSIAQIRAGLSVQVSDIPDFILLRAYRWVSNLMSATTWSILQLIMGGLFLCGLYIVLLKDLSIKKAYSWSLLAGLLAFSLVCGLMSYHSQLVERGGDQAISMEDQELYKAADDRSESVVTIGPGNKLFLLDVIGDWYKVQLRDKDTGWVKKEKVSLI